jgi:hypothetical protein
MRKKFLCFAMLCATLFTATAQADTLSGATLRLAQALEKQVVSTTYILSEVAQNGYSVDLVSWMPGQNDPPKLIPGHTYQVRGEKRNQANLVIFQAWSGNFTSDTPSVTLTFSLSGNYEMSDVTMKNVPGINPGDNVYAYFHGTDGSWAGYAYGTVDDKGNTKFYTVDIPLTEASGIQTLSIYRSTGNGQEFLGTSQISGQSFVDAIINGATSLDLEFVPVDEATGDAVFAEQYAHDSMLLQGVNDVFGQSYQTLSYEVKLEKGKTYSVITSPPTDSNIKPARQIFLRIIQEEIWLATESFFEPYQNNVWGWMYYPVIENWTCPATGTYTIQVEEAWGYANTGFGLQVVPQD